MLNSMLIQRRTIQWLSDNGVSGRLEFRILLSVSAAGAWRMQHAAALMGVAIHRGMGW
jgi:hypothetical protein